MIMETTTIDIEGPERGISITFSLQTKEGLTTKTFVKQIEEELINALKTIEITPKNND